MADDNEALDDLRGIPRAGLQEDAAEGSPYVAENNEASDVVRVMLQAFGQRTTPEWRMPTPQNER